MFKIQKILHADYIAFVFFVWLSEQAETFLTYTALTYWFLKPKLRVFTARYIMSPYITQIRFVFKGLIITCLFICEKNVCC